MVRTAIDAAEPLVGVHTVDAPAARFEALGDHVGRDVDAGPEIGRVGGLADLEALAGRVAVADLPAQSVVGNAVDRLAPVADQMHRVGVVTGPQVAVVARSGARIRGRMHGEHPGREASVAPVDDLLFDVDHGHSPVGMGIDSGADETSVSVSGWSAVLPVRWASLMPSTTCWPCTAASVTLLLCHQL